MNNELSMTDIVIHYIKTINQDDILDTAYEVHQNSAKYLLGQTVRQLSLPRSKYYLSKKAKETWAQIRDEDIYNYWSRSSVEKTIDGEVTVELYKGASKLPYDTRTLQKGDKFTFNDVFHDDHIIPIKLILKRLLALKNPSRENVLEILNDITVCRMLKSEDRSIYRRHKRPYSEDEVVNGIYVDVGIELINYDYKK